MSYERHLAFNLRVRGLSESEIANVLKDGRANPGEGTRAAKYGSAGEHAKQYPKKKRRTLGKTITTAGVLLAVAYLFLSILLMLFFRFDVRDVVGPVSLAPAGALVVASVLMGFLADYFRPLPARRKELDAK